MNRRITAYAIVSASVFAVSLATSAQLGGAAGVQIPYNGYLENGGVPVVTAVDLTFDLYNDPAGLTPCDTLTELDVVPAAGRFAVVLGPVNETCVKDRDVYLEVTVNDDDGATQIPGRTLLLPALSSYTSGRGDFDVSADLAVAGSLGVGGNFTAGGTITAGDVIANNAFVGDVGHGGSFAGFSHTNQIGTQSYALLASTSGDTFVNTAPGRTMYFRSDNTDRIVMGANGDLDLVTGRMVPDYDTGWVNATSNNINVHNHNLATIPLQWEILVATGPNGTGDVSIGGDQWLFDNEGESRGVMVTGITTTSFVARTGKDHLIDTFGLAGTRIFDNNGSYRVLVWR